MKKVLSLMSLVLMFMALGWTQTASGRTVYLKPSSNWLQDGARFALYTFIDDDNSAWTDLSDSDGDGIYEATFDNSYASMIFCRMNPSQTENNWDHKWNQTNDLNVPTNDHTLYTLPDGLWNYFNPSTSLLGYVALGSTALFGSDWSSTEDNIMTLGGDGKYHLTKTGLSLNTGVNYEFKVIKDGTTWYPSGDNVIVTVPKNGEYQLDITFDPATSNVDYALYSYLVDFNTPVTTSGVPDFAVASNWSHIVKMTSGYYEDSYVSYSYIDGDGMDASNTLRVYGNSNYDLLVTPVVSGNVTIYVKPVAPYYNDSAVLKFYSLNADGTEKDAELATTNFKSKSNSEIWDWIPVTITLDTPQRIGIYGNNVYMDNFAATDATIIPETKVIVASVMNLAGQTGTNGTNPQFSQGPDGNTTVKLKVTLENTGDVDLVAGQTENYTLTLAEGNSSNATTYYEDATINVPVNIAVGQSATFEVEFSAPIVPTYSGYTYFYIRENIKGKTSSSYRYAQVVKYESKFIFDKEGTSYYSSSSATTTPIDFGKITEATTLNYEIFNQLTAPLTINSITLPLPFTSNAPATPFTVAGGEKKVIAITMPYGDPGIFTGDLVINYTNYGKEAADYTLGISGTIVDPTKNYITFSNADNTNGQFPAGSIHSDNVYISDVSSGDVNNYALSSTSTVTKFITPLLTAEAGESLTFDAWYTGNYGNNGNAYVTVYTSPDRVTWTEIAKHTYSTGVAQAVKTFTATIAEAGDYYLAFEIGSMTKLDNIYGLTLADTPAHDWYITEEATIPTTGKQNTAYTASIKVQNIAAEADNLTATLYMDGEAMVTEEISLAGNDKTAAEGTGNNNYSNIKNPTTIELTFTPHAFGTFPAYIELKAGDTTLETAPVEVTISQEVLSSDIAVGESKTTKSTVPFYFTWADDSSGKSMCDFAYSAAELKAFDIIDGAKIKSITFKGSPTSTKIFSNGLTVDVWVGMEAAGTLTSATAGSADTENMYHQTIIDESSYSFTSGETYDFVVTFDNPLVYDGVSDIRVFTNTNGHGSYINMNFATDNNYSNAYYAHGTGSYTSAYAVPVGYFGLEVEPKTLSGTVTTGTSPLVYPVEGATVTIRNDENDIEYFATTDADGNYSINVVRDQLTYTATVTADGYLDATETELSFAEASQTKNFTMNPDVLTLSDQEDFTPVAQKKAVYLQHSFKSGFNTLVLPFTLTAEQFAGLKNLVDKNLKLYELVGYDETEGALEFDVATSLEADKPYVLWASKDFNINQLLLSVSPKLGAPAIFDISGEGASTLEFGDVKFIGSYKAKTLVEGAYNHYGITTAGQIRPGGTGSFIKGQRAYLEIPADVAAHMVARFNDGGEATAIENARIVDLNGPVYDLNGRKMNTTDGLKKGVYVVNGRKVIIK